MISVTRKTRWFYGNKLYETFKSTFQRNIFDQEVKLIYWKIGDLAWEYYQNVRIYYKIIQKPNMTRTGIFKDDTKNYDLSSPIKTRNVEFIFDI